MRKISFLPLLFLGLSAGIHAQSLPRQGASVPVVFVQEVNSRKPSGPIIEIAEDLVDAHNKVVVKRGTPVKCTCNMVAARRVGRPGSIEIKFLSTLSIHGTNIPLTGIMKLEGENLKPKVLGFGLGVGLFAPPMLLYLLKKGGDVSIPSKAKSVIPRIAQNTFEQ